MDNYRPHHRRYFTGRTCALKPDGVTLLAINEALHLAELALREGRLITPLEAMAVALGEAREKETLFSIARSVAWASGGNQDDILCRLGERFPDFA
jgi:hypothetical protein